MKEQYTKNDSTKITKKTGENKNLVEKIFEIKEVIRSETIFTKISSYFIKNLRITFIVLAVLFGLGSFAMMNLKTTGFPSPSIDSISIQTTYIGASSSTVNSKITIPLEGKVKEVTGIENVYSTSTDNQSVITATLRDGYDVNKVRQEVENKVKSTVLPVGTDTPLVAIPDFGAVSTILTIRNQNNDNLESLYNLANTLKKEISNLPGTSKVTEVTPLVKRLVIKVNQDRLKEIGYTQDRLFKEMQTIGQSIPVISDVVLDNKNASLTATTDIKSLPEFIDYKITDSVKVSDILLSVTPEFKFISTNQTAVVSQPLVQPVSGFSGDYFSGYTLNISTIKNTDQVKFSASIDDILAKEGNKIVYYDMTKDTDKNKEVVTSDKLLVLKQFSAAANNKSQVDDILGSLIGSELKIDNKALSKFGFLFGGIQLLFIVLALLVSWRSALIACLSVPLSLVFTLIYLYITGESLNTLVLFSFVLVVGLVTDPVLVMLESMQRKFDKGDVGLHIVEDAVNEVGSGLFLAFLTNTIIFLPFLLVSGIFGQIIRYIPITIVPAAFGSLLIPLIFIPIVGYKFLRPKKNASNQEYENLWTVSKLLIRLNRFLLSKPFLSTFVIIGLLVLSLGTAWFYNTKGLVKNVQFATADTVVERVQFIGSFKQEMPTLERQELIGKSIDIISNYPNVYQVFPYATGQNRSGDFAYLVEFRDGDRQINKTLEDMLGKIKLEIGGNGEKLFYYSLKIVANGPSNGDYQITYAIKNEDPKILKKATLELSRQLDFICYNKDKQEQFFVDERCGNENAGDIGQKVVEKFNNGFTNSSTSLEVLVNKEKATKQGLDIGIITAQIKDLFAPNGNKKIATLKDSVGADYDIVTIPDATLAPKTLENLKNTELKLPNKIVKLSDVADIVVGEGQSIIRRTNKEALNTIEIGIKKEFNDQANVSKIQKTFLDYLQKPTNISKLGIPSDNLSVYSQGASSSISKSFGELLTALILAVFLSYIVLSLFFKSFLQPINILFSLSLTFIGVYPALYLFTNGQFGFLEIIGLVILIGILENVAIFLLDDAYARIDNGVDDKEAIALASGFRLRPVVLTSITNLASSIPVILFSVDYRSLTLVIVSGLLVGGILSLITIPILFIALRRVPGLFKKLFKFLAFWKKK
jgi:hydrophobic/amphiphilic exporter-1 (mainly G- bacteria), HAE1 family